MDLIRNIPLTSHSLVSHRGILSHSLVILRLVTVKIFRGKLSNFSFLTKLLKLFCTNCQAVEQLFSVLTTINITKGERERTYHEIVVVGMKIL